MKLLDPIGETMFHAIQVFGNSYYKRLGLVEGGLVDDFLNRNSCPETYRFRAAGTRSSK